MEYKCSLSLLWFLVYGTMRYGTSATGVISITSIFGKALPSGYFTRLHGLSYLRCRHQCNIRRRCHSAEYETRTMSCRMHPYRLDSDYGLIEAPGMVHIRLQTWSDRSEQLPCGMCDIDQACNTQTERCIYTECSALIAPENGYTEGSMVYVGAKSMIYCDNNTYVINTVVVPVQTTCLPTGSWSVDSITCYKLSDIACDPEDYLISGPTGMIAKSITASTFHPEVDQHGPLNALLDNSVGWSSNVNDAHQYIQVEFHGLRLVTGVVTQGRPDHFNQWVTNYGVATSPDCITFTDVRDSNGAIVNFAGNTDIHSKVVNMLETSVNALCVRIKPTAWSGHISLRFDVLGCDGPNMLNYRLIN